MNHQSTFIVCGRFARKFVNDRLASLTLKVELENGAPRIDMVTFDPTLMATIENLNETHTLKVAGTVRSARLKARGNKPVFVDGYEKWIPQLIIDEILECISSDIALQEQAGSPPASDDDIPF